jgi:hypothetical protein
LLAHLRGQKVVGYSLPRVAIRGMGWAWVAA